MTELQAVFDHAEINVVGQLDAAWDRYRQLGFQLTSGGEGSSGSRQHLAIFGENYLALVGNAAGSVELPGLTGLAWKTADADESWRALQQRGLESDPPVQFHDLEQRPEGDELPVTPRSVQIAPQRLVNGRSLFCEHLTPQQVSMQHPNGATEISEFVLVSRDPALSTDVYRQLFGSGRFRACLDGAFLLQAGVTRVRFASEAYVTERYGILPPQYDGSPRMAALGFSCRSLSHVRQLLSDNGIAVSERDGGLVVGPDDALGVTLRFDDRKTL